VWAPVRDEEVIKPTQFAKEDFQDMVKRLGHERPTPLFNWDLSKSTDAHSKRLQVIQDKGYNDRSRSRADLVVLDIYPDGTLSIIMNVTGLVEQDSMSITGISMYYLDPEQVRTRLVQAWAYAYRFWQHIDEYHRYNAMLYNVGLHHIDHYRFEPAPVGNRTSFTLPNRNRPPLLLAYEKPITVVRADLEKPTDEITESLDRLKMRFRELDRNDLF
jgi:hypothetical protein